MCYQVEVLEYNEDKTIITVGESQILGYHDTDVSVEKPSITTASVTL